MVKVVGSRITKVHRIAAGDVEGNDVGGITIGVSMKAMAKSVLLNNDLNSNKDNKDNLGSNIGNDNNVNKDNENKEEKKLLNVLSGLSATLVGTSLFEPLVVIKDHIVIADHSRLSSVAIVNLVDLKVSAILAIGNDLSEAGENMASAAAIVEDGSISIHNTAAIRRVEDDLENVDK